MDEAIRPEDDAFDFLEEEKIPVEEDFKFEEDTEEDTDIDLETDDSVLAEDLPFEEKFDWDEAEGELKEIRDSGEDTSPEVQEDRAEIHDEFDVDDSLDVETEPEERLIVAEEPEEDAFSWVDETVEPAEFDVSSLDEEISWEVPPPVEDSVEESADMKANQTEAATDAEDDYQEDTAIVDDLLGEEAEEAEEIDWGMESAVSEWEDESDIVEEEQVPSEAAETSIPDSDFSVAAAGPDLSTETSEAESIPPHAESPDPLDELETIKASLEQGEGRLMTILESFRSSQDPLGFSSFQKQAADTIERFTQEMEQTLETIRDRIHALDSLDLVPREDEEISEEENPLEEVLFFSVSDRIFALPTANVTGIFKVPSQKAYDLIKQKEMVIKDRVIPIRSSWEALEIQKRTGDFFAGEKRILLMSTRQGETAFVVDDIVGRQSMEMAPADQEDPKCFAGVVKIEKQAYVLNPEAL